MIVWRKSSHSGTQGGTNCVEVARLWRKSSHSGTSSGTQCVEVAELPGRPARAIAVRDSKNPNGPKLHLTPTQWSTLLATIKTTS